MKKSRLKLYSILLAIILLLPNVALAKNNVELVLDNRSENTYEDIMELSMDERKELIRVVLDLNIILRELRLVSTNVLNLSNVTMADLSQGLLNQMYNDVDLLDYQFEDVVYNTMIHLDRIEKQYIEIENILDRILKENDFSNEMRELVGNIGIYIDILREEIDFQQEFNIVVLEHILKNPNYEMYNEYMSIDLEKLETGYYNDFIELPIMINNYINTIGSTVIESL